MFFYVSNNFVELDRLLVLSKPQVAFMAYNLSLYLPHSLL